MMFTVQLEKRSLEASTASLLSSLGLALTTVAVEKERMMTAAYMKFTGLEFEQAPRAPPPTPIARTTTSSHLYSRIPTPPTAPPRPSTHTHSSVACLPSPASLASSLGRSGIGDCAGVS